MKIFCCYTPSHNQLFHEDFLPTIPAGFTVQSQIIEMFGEGHYDSPQFVPCVVKKVDLILQSLRENAGNVIIWSDVDIQFYRLTPDIAMAELDDRDIAFQAAGIPPTDVNSGFFICRCNQRVIQFFEKVRHSLCHDDAGEIEERVINKFLPALSEAELSWCMLPRRFYARSNKWPPPRDLLSFTLTPLRALTGWKKNIVNSARSRCYNGTACRYCSIPASSMRRAVLAVFGMNGDYNGWSPHLNPNLRPSPRTQGDPVPHTRLLPKDRRPLFYM
jgi:hypothetical protein